ncbi:pyridoxamine 5'-phosphate oxidase family protein [Paraburkholderia sp. PREW-6R]|uniref:HugZ family pyridoxamine 5'-phosphate oxidase n=1 Tax=Paraburkholderia sp. PREW-6R TaxID=3141544 RepID=UPI0031F4D2C7
MNIPAHAPLHLLHTAAVGTLATHARQPEGFPYPSVLPFAPDAQHRPTILISRLAEHTHNLLADPHAGFLAVDAPDGDVLDGQRVTLLGTFEAIEPTPAVVRRYLRYHPEAERYLALGDFTFWSMRLSRLRYIGGFGAMGWLDGAELDPLTPLDDEEENTLVELFVSSSVIPAGVQLLGVDRYGADLKANGRRVRCVFDEPKTDSASLEAALRGCIASKAY